MPGARIVLNSRFFHIARAGEKADGKHAMTRNASMGLVNYVGTRESVELNVNQTSMNGEEITALNLDRNMPAKGFPGITVEHINGFGFRLMEGMSIPITGWERCITPEKASGKIMRWLNPITNQQRMEKTNTRIML